MSAAEWREVTDQQTLVFEKRGRMLRRAIKFDRPHTYERTLYAKAWVRGDGNVSFRFTVAPCNRVRPEILCNGSADIGGPFLEWKK